MKKQNILLQEIDIKYDWTDIPVFEDEHGKRDRPWRYYPIEKWLWTGQTDPEWLRKHR